MCNCNSGLAGTLPQYKPFPLPQITPIAAEANPFSNPYQTPTNPSSAERAVKNTDRRERIGGIISTIGNIFATVGGAVTATTTNGQPSIPGGVVVQPTIDQNGNVIPTDPTAILQMQCAQRGQQYDINTGMCEPIGNTKPDFARIGLVLAGGFLIYTLAKRA